MERFFIPVRRDQRSCIWLEIFCSFFVLLHLLRDHLDHVWRDSRANLGIDKAEMQLLIFEGHRREQSLISDDLKEMPLHQIWNQGEDDYDFLKDLGLGKWGVEIDMSATNTINFLCSLKHGNMKPSRSSQQQMNFD